MNGIRGVAPMLSPSQREFVRSVERRRRELLRKHLEAKDALRLLPTTRELADQFGCQPCTIRKVALGQGFAHDAVAL